ncbi:hypothetical protein ACLKA7_012121, partial [Drosophila subpalustris]
SQHYCASLSSGRIAQTLFTIGFGADALVRFRGIATTLSLATSTAVLTLATESPFMLAAASLPPLPTAQRIFLLRLPYVRVCECPVASRALFCSAFRMQLFQHSDTEKRGMAGNIRR